MLLELLTQVGLNERERTLYQSLLEHGRSSASGLSKSTGIPRATIYGLLDGLQQRGVVSVEAARDSTYYSPSAVNSLLRSIEKEKEALTAKEQAAKQLGELIAPLLGSRQLAYPKIKLAEGKENIENMLYEVFTGWRKAVQEEERLVYGYQDASFVEEFRRFLDWRWRTASEGIRFFSNMTATEKDLLGKVPGRQVRPLPFSVEFRSSLYVFGQQHVMIVATREKPLRALLLTEQDTAANLQAIFKLAWELSPEASAGRGKAAK